MQEKEIVKEAHDIINPMFEKWEQDEYLNFCRKMREKAENKIAHTDRGCYCGACLHHVAYLANESLMDDLSKKGMTQEEVLYWFEKDKYVVIGDGRKSRLTTPSRMEEEKHQKAFQGRW